MTSVASQRIDSSPRVLRQRDRRLGWATVLSALSAAIPDRSDPSRLRTVFEKELCRLTGFQFRLRDRTRHFTPAAPYPSVLETTTIDVPGTAGKHALEGAFRPGAAKGEWDLQNVHIGAHLAALVLEIERGRVAEDRSPVEPPRKPSRDGAAPLIGDTDAIRILRSQIERVAHTDFTVLLEGESGVGKELVARQIHALSKRRNGPFVAINCAALVETLLEAELFGIEERTATGVRGRRGKFEHADGGTLFLDEVSDLSLSAQAKLLRAIQDVAVERVGGHGTHRVDTRIIAATNRPLHGLVDRQLFRADLFFRLSGVDIHVPSLRERRADILPLARYFMSRHHALRSLDLSTTAADALVAYDWPGNVRELERLMERVVALASSDVVGLDDLPPKMRGDVIGLARNMGTDSSMRAWGSRYARLVLERCGGNKREACRVLQISYHTLNAYLGYVWRDC